MDFRALSKLVAALLVCLALAGCGGAQSIGRKAVTGTVSMDGKPMDYGSINFQPIEGNSKQIGAGAVVENGAYSIPADQGLTPGKYRVVITSPTGGKPSGPQKGESPEEAMKRAGTPPTERLPPKYNSESELTAEVTASAPPKFDFKVESIKE